MTLRRILTALKPRRQPDRYRDRLADLILRVRVRRVMELSDLWVGVFIDRGGRTVYMLPVPCLGIRVSLVKPLNWDDHIVRASRPDTSNSPGLRCKGTRWLRYGARHPWQAKPRAGERSPCPGCNDCSPAPGGGQ